MIQQLLPGLRIVLVMTVLLGIAYPLAITGLSQMLFPHQANGSLITENGKVVGSEIIGQNFTRPEYFHPRPSSAGSNGYDAAASSGSNLGPASKKLIDRVTAAAKEFRKENPAHTGPIPVDLLTTSASGLDPHISPEGARAQAARVAGARGISVSWVTQLIDNSIEPPDFGLLGEPRVNVLRLNRELNRRYPVQPVSQKHGQ